MSLKFVVQKHAASRLHYDFRLEVDGALASWAIPKGPSLDPHDRRLAVRVEDHPLDYGSFEGEIAEGEYGAGDVIVWDTGDYIPDGALAGDPNAAARGGIAGGKLDFTLRGEKLRGGWTLVHMPHGNDNWLLIKRQDEFASSSTDVLAKGRSVLSGREVEQREASGSHARTAHSQRDADPPPRAAGAPPRSVRRSERSAVGGPAAGAAPPPTGKEIEALLDVLDHAEGETTLDVQGAPVRLTSLERVLWPETADHRVLAKRDLIRYWLQAAPHALPHLRDRPLTLNRFPDGVGGKHFIQRVWEAERPDFVESVDVYSTSNSRDREYLLCSNLATLLWLVQIAALELHTWYSRSSGDGTLPTAYGGSERGVEASALNYPDYLVFDLDPYLYSGNERHGEEPELNRPAWQAVCDIAAYIRQTLAEDDLAAFVKTSGKTGVHIFVPIERRYSFDVTRAACEVYGRRLVEAHPDEVTLEWHTEERRGKVFCDVNQNSRSKSLAAVYSPRAVPQAGVSAPIAWEDLRAIYPADLNLLTMPERLERHGDPWTHILSRRQPLRLADERLMDT